MKDKSSYRHYRLVIVTVKIKLRLINSFRPVYVSSLACSLFPLFSLLSGEEKNLISIFVATNSLLVQLLVYEFGSKV